MNLDNRRALNEIRKGIPGEIEKILWGEGQRVMGESVKICPVDTGRLRASRYVKTPTKLGNRLTLEMGYNTDYALYVHEDLEAYHRPPTQAKFLETPLRRNLPRIEKRIRERVAEVTK